MALKSNSIKHKLKFLFSRDLYQLSVITNDSFVLTMKNKNNKRNILKLLHYHMLDVLQCFSTKWSDYYYIFYIAFHFQRSDF